MPKPTYIVRPQRQISGMWTNCPDHQAQRYAVLLQRVFKHSGKGYTSLTLAYHCLRKAEAEAECARLTRAAEPWPRRILGGRFGLFRGEPIATGIPVSAHAQPCSCRACRRSASDA